MPQSWPDDIIPERYEFLLQHNTTIFTSPITKSRQVLRRQGERWVMTASFLLERRVSQRLDALLAKLRGAYDTVNVWDFARPEPLGVNTDQSTLPVTFFTDGTGFAESGSPTVITGFSGGGDGVVVHTAVTPGALIFLTDGWVASTAGQLKAGDYVGVDGRLYMLTEDLDSDDLGRGYANVAPGVRAAIADGAEVTRSYVVTEMQLVDDDQAARTLDGGGNHYQYTLSMIEAL